MYADAEVHAAHARRKKSGVETQHDLSDSEHAAWPSMQFDGAVYMLCHNSLIRGQTARGSWQGEDGTASSRLDGVF